LNVQPPMIVLADNEIDVVSDVPKNALRGTVAGFQFAAVLKSFDAGV
jgi:hypothetical protein